MLVSSKPPESITNSTPKVSYHHTTPKNNAITVHGATAAQLKKAIITVSPSGYKVTNIQLMNASPGGGASVAGVDSQGSCSNAEEEKEVFIRRILGPCVT